MVALAEMNSDWIGEKIIITLIYFSFVSKGENGLVDNIGVKCFTQSAFPIPIILVSIVHYC